MRLPAVEAAWDKGSRLPPMSSWRRLARGLGGVDVGRINRSAWGGGDTEWACRDIGTECDLRRMFEGTVRWTEDWAPMWWLAWVTLAFIAGGLRASGVGAEERLRWAWTDVRPVVQDRERVRRAGAGYSVARGRRDGACIGRVQPLVPLGWNSHGWQCVFAPVGDVVLCCQACAQPWAI